MSLNELIAAAPYILMGNLIILGFVSISNQYAYFAYCRRMGRNVPDTTFGDRTKGLYYFIEMLIHFEPEMPAGLKFRLCVMRFLTVTLALEIGAAMALWRP